MQRATCVFKMSSSEEDVVVAWQFLRNRRKRRRLRRYWIHPLFVHNLSHSPVTGAQKQLSLNPEKFKEYYRMTQENFRVLVELVGPRIEKLDTHYREPISSEERLLITLSENLRFSENHLDIHCSFRVFLALTMQVLVHPGVTLGTVEDY
ncbi:hypothetical protein Trydic_g23061 [Trypoxylus dichotomus]